MMVFSDITPRGLVDRHLYFDETVWYMPTSLCGVTMKTKHQYHLQHENLKSHNNDF